MDPKWTPRIAHRWDGFGFYCALSKRETKERWPELRAMPNVRRLPSACVPKDTGLTGAL